jgi:Mg-chelatase subunit ChlD
MTKAKTRNRPVTEGKGSESLVSTPTPKAPRQTKAALLRARLSEPGGVSLATLIEVTGWQAHTLRAALSGLRKEGLTLTRRREGADTIYAIDTSGSEASGPLESGK